MGLKALIDCDIFRYEQGSVTMNHPLKITDEDGYIVKVPATKRKIESLVKAKIDEIISATGAEDYICVLSGTGNFRNDIAKQQPYKGNRDPNLSRPHHYETVGNYIVSTYNNIVVDGIEADDWLGIEQRKDLTSTIICSRDKDLGTVPGWHYRWQCGTSQPERPNHYISDFEAVKFFMFQMLIGDHTDNIPGCGKKQLVKWGKEPDGSPRMVERRKGVGEGAAKKILDKCSTVQEMYDAILEEYKVVFPDNYEEVMLENARLLYIGQTPDNLFEWNWLDFSCKSEWYSELKEEHQEKEE
ncbi:putative 5'-3' exonuclease [Aeromonas phage LAh_9]|uniref:5'-3' exonuclease n=4 Tax=Lahexavirus TaxID=2843411 RepID=A0A5B9N8V9_9CAUD|nr:exonuclease [Aeromonas phage 4_4572]YP_009847217.1 exonuclease [Aeromonas phage LAh_6]YP_009847440.1 exonuclease [Aeromonas phage LAh_8]YP_009847601.1 exonuclease [Aeromonas phage LAh_9]QDH46505.1 putative 5'-3' exonuclease [Aeromonas phage LAh_6]QDH46741.1 putative 5'-3' exonuclease [Aeromonas phage LAh_8]QDH46886.1 putative 5'-3' exonuclease [Aeromonas phage LAh_9]QEG09046.1 5'-3' exonuclease [Aeromonas phage 4_4572]